MRDFIFRYRGWLFIPAALLMLYLAKPTMLSLAVGFAIVFLGGEAIRIWAVGYSGVTTRKSELDAPQLVTAGPYGLVRNPLYLGNLISWLGFCAAASGGANLVERIVIFGATIISYLIIYGNIIPHEEQFLAGQYGEQFQDYLKKVPCFLPNFKAYDNPQGKWKPSVILTAESQTIIMLLAVAAVMVLKFLKILPF